MDTKLINVFQPTSLGKLELRNAFIKAATNEGMCRNSIPTDAMIEFHGRLAEGGVGLTTVSYGAISKDAKTFAQQLEITPNSLAVLARLTERVHASGGKASIQLTHCGFFTNDTSKKIAWAPSRVFNAYGALSHLRFSREMDSNEMYRIKEGFVRALRGIISAGFDTAEVHMGHGYLLSQYLSPITNKRKDQYGGVIQNRARFPLEVFQAMREAAPDFPLLVKLNMNDGLPGGFDLEDCVYVVNELEKLGCDAVELTGGFTSKSPFYLLRGKVPLKGMQETAPTRMERITMRLLGKAIVKPYEFEPNFFLNQATEIRRRVNMPLVYLGGIDSLENIRMVDALGFEFIALGRPLIHDPDFILKLQRGEILRTGCNRCNECIVEMNRSTGVRCVLSD